MKNVIASLIFLFIVNGCEKEGDSGKSEKCYLIPDTGPCMGIATRYYFDQVEGKCKEFTWGGCAGLVPFETLEECVQCECEKSAKK